MNKQNVEIPDFRGVNENKVKFPWQAWALAFGLGNSNGYNNFAEFPEVYKASVAKTNQSDKSKDFRYLF